MKNTLLFLLTIGSAVCSVVGAPVEMVLFDKGVEIAPIIVAPPAAPRTREAATVLADYLEKITGAKPKVIEGAPAALPERAIWIGVQPALKPLFPKTNFAFKHPEEILIAAAGNHLVLAGRDAWDPAHTEAKGRLAMKTGVQQEYGTANAVYTFLQEKLNVRWLWPGEEDVPKAARVAFAPFEYRYHPQIRARGGMLKFLSLGDTKEGPGQLWSRYQRNQLDSLEILGGHAFGEWWDKYHVSHPEYFALQPDGTRSPHPTPSHSKLCDSNPDVWKQWLVEVEEQLRENPTRRLFNVSPNDGYDYGHCVCPQCLAKDHPAGEKFTWRWKGKHEEWPALSDRQVTFANTLARLLKQRFPDQPYAVQLHAYGYSRPAPIAAVPDDNIIISSVANFHLRGDGGGEESAKARQQFADWSKKAKQIMWRPNLGNPAGREWGMPDVGFAQTAEDFRFVADHHCVGLYFDMLWMHWGTQGPYYYLLAHLAWNPYADAEGVMNDYYERAFGPAAPELKAYWTLLEKTRAEFVQEIPNRYRAFDLPQKYTPELLAKAQALLHDAAAKTAGADEKYRRRVAFMRCGFDYTQNLVATRAAMQKFEASKNKDAAAKAQALAGWDAAARMKKTFPPYAINWVGVFREGGKEKRVMGLHPDTPLSGRVKREKETRNID